MQKYGDVNRKEIEECIVPQLVICGGTFEYAKKIFGVEKKEIQLLSCGAQYFVKKNIVYIQFVHPSWFSVNRKILFAYAKDVLEEIKKVMKW